MDGHRLCQSTAMCMGAGTRLRLATALGPHTPCAGITTTRLTAHAVATVVACCFHSGTYRAHSMPASDGQQRPRWLLWVPEGLKRMPHRAHSRLPVVDPSEHGSASGEMRPQPRLPMWGQGEPSPAGADVAASACTRWGTWQTLDSTLSVLRSAPLRVSTYSADAGGAIGENSSA